MTRKKPAKKAAKAPARVTKAGPQPDRSFVLDCSPEAGYGKMRRLTNAFSKWAENHA